MTLQFIIGVSKKIDESIILNTRNSTEIICISNNISCNVLIRVLLTNSSSNEAKDFKCSDWK